MKISVTVSGISDEAGRRALDKLRQALADRTADRPRQGSPPVDGVTPSKRGARHGRGKP